LVVVPTIGAAHALQRSFANQRAGLSCEAPELVTRDQLYDRLHARMSDPPGRLSPVERDAIAQAAAAEAAAALQLTEAFDIRPGLVAEMLRFYDQLRRQAQRTARFEELLVDYLSPDAAFDRGAERMLQQTRLLASTFRAYERRVADSGAVDEHLLRERLLAAPLASPVRAIVVTVADWIAEPAGLHVVDFDLLARLPGVDTIELIATEGVLASGFHQRLHDWLPGLEEVDDDAGSGSRGRPSLAVPSVDQGSLWFRARDREEELIALARRFKAERRAQSAAHSEQVPLDRVAIAYKRPLPYLYLARTVFEAAGMPYQTTDTLPLAAEPFAAALDLVFEFVSSSFTRPAIVALLRSPHFGFQDDGHPISRESISALDRGLSDDRYLGGLEHLSRLPEIWAAERSKRDAMPALRAAVEAARVLAELQTRAPISAQIETLFGFVRRQGVTPDTGQRLDGDPASSLANRLERGRTAILDTLERLADASRIHNDTPVDVGGLTAAAHRWIEEQTFDPRMIAEDGVHLLDEDAARYGDFRELALVGLIEGEWPERPRRNVFYQPSLLRALGWPSERDWRAGAEARFLDLLASPAGRVWLSSITLDDEGLVEPSTLLEEIPRARLRTVACDPSPRGRMFRDEALSVDPVAIEPLDGEARSWAGLRLERTPGDDAAFHGQIGHSDARVWSVSALETYQQCPFKFFARYVLKLEEEPDDEEVMDPRSQGEFVHTVFERFFADWQAAGRGAVTPDNLDEARRVFETVVDRSLSTLPEAEAGLERTRLLGSSAAAGLGEAVLRMEAERPVPVVERLLEHILTGDFTIQTPSGARSVPLRGKADRLDLLADGTFRLIDYKLGWPPNKSRALQLPIYSLCAEQKLRGHRGRNWTLCEAVCVAFKGPRRVTPLFQPGDRDRSLQDAQERLAVALDGIEAGDFPPKPEDVFLCETCAYAAVCRTDYVDDL
jgi:RecB family exonuclease/inactivated superfamily I helicase